MVWWPLLVFLPFSPHLVIYHLRFSHHVATVVVINFKKKVCSAKTWPIWTNVGLNHPFRIIPYGLTNHPTWPLLPWVELRGKLKNKATKQHFPRSFNSLGNYILMSRMTYMLRFVLKHNALCRCLAIMSMSCLWESSLLKVPSQINANHVVEFFPTVHFPFKMAAVTKIEISLFDYSKNWLCKVGLF